MTTAGASNAARAQTATDVGRTLAEVRRALRALTAAARAFGEAGEEHELLQEFCRILVEICGYRFAWVGYAEQEAERRVRPVAWAGHEAGYLTEIRVSWSDDAHGRGPTGTAIRTGRPCVFRDAPSDPSYGPWSVPARQRGYASSAALPLRVEDQVIGALSVYSAQVEAFDSAEAELLTNLADGLAGGLQALRARLGRQVAEEALRRERDTAQQYLDLAAVIMVALDREGRITLINRKGCELLGYREDELLGRDWFELCLPVRLRARIMSAFRALIAGEIEPHAYVLNAIVTRGGAERLIAWHNTVLRASDGRIQGTLSSGEDVTDRQRAEQLLRRRTDELESLASNAPDAIARLDRELRFIFVNPRFCELVGRPREDCLGRTSRELGLPPEQCEFWERTAGQVFQTGQAQSTEFQLVSAGGKHDYHARVVPESDSDGRILTALAITRDITELRQLQQGLTVAQRVEVVGQLAAGVAHDLNNVLTAIAGYAALVRTEQPEGGPAVELLDRLDDAIQQAAAVTRGLLACSHHTAPERSPVTLQKVVSSAAHLLRRVLPAQVRVEIVGGDAAPLWLLADQTQLQQVLLNLGVNARDAMPNGGTLQIALGRADAAQLPDLETPGGQVVCLTVRDSGTGIASADLPRVFEPFFTTKPAGRGTGLGLAIVQRIVAAHRGRITVHSQPGQGTEFAIYLPRLLEPTSAPRTADTVPPVRGHGELILVAEDHPEVARVLVAGLEQAGYRVVHAADAATLLVEYARHEAALRLLIVDVDLPKGSGLESLRRVRRAGCKLPALVVTGVIDPDLTAQLDSRTRLLAKPVRLATLLGTIADLLCASESAPQPT